MPTEVHVPCPNCDARIPFYTTVDDLKECPECGASKDELFEIAQTPDVDTAADVQPALTDGGTADE